MNMHLTLSPLPKTWIFDLDGTILRHNGYKTEAGDQLLSGVKEFFSSISEEDMVIIITSRSEDFRDETENVLRNSGIRWDTIIWNAPCGERILFNDQKESGLKTAYAVNFARDKFPKIEMEIDTDL